MKELTRILALLLLLATGCQSPSAEWPEDLEGKKALLKAKRQEQATLNQEIERLRSEIEAIQPSLAAQGKLVTTGVLVPSDFEHFAEVQGVVSTGKTVSVTAEVPGRILQLLVDEGDRVTEGQLVAELDLEQILKQIEEVEIALALAITVYERQKRLWEQNIGSELQYLEAKNNKDRLENNLETLRVQARKSKVYSPLTGVVNRVSLRQGEYASPGMPIVQLLDMDDLRVAADVPETYLRVVRRGARVRVRFPALDMEQAARITLIGNTINNANRTFKVEAAVQNSNKLLKPNLLAIMYIKDYSVEDALVVPQELVQQEVSGKDYIMIKGEGPDGPVAQKVYVQTGESYNNEVRITDGLQGGEELILEGARGLSDQQPIRVQDVKTEANNG